MSQKPFRITFVLAEEDVAYFRALYRKARQQASRVDRAQVTREVSALIDRVRAIKKTPSFVREAVDLLEQMLHMLEDTDYALPKRMGHEVLAALAYFANPHDLIPDSIPGLGFLDDAIMIKIMSEEFQHELWGYDKFTAFRKGAEQRPWTAVARVRLPARLAEKRREIRAAVDARKAAHAKKRRLFW